MNLANILGREIFYPLATLVIPGFTAIAPYILILLHYYPGFISLWDKNSGSIITGLIVSSVAAGLILEDVGAMVESRLWDTLRMQKDRDYINTWYSYLMLVHSESEDAIAHNYLKTILLRMKFELGFGLSLLIAWGGLLWLQIVCALWSWIFFLVLTLILYAISFYLLYESYLSTGVLSNIRSLLVHKRLPNRSEEGKGILYGLMAFFIFLSHIIFFFIIITLFVFEFGPNAMDANDSQHKPCFQVPKPSKIPILAKSEATNVSESVL